MSERSPIITSAMCGAAAAVVMTLMKSSKGEKLDKVELLGIFALVASLVFSALKLSCNPANLPTLSEPFITSLES